MSDMSQLSLCESFGISDSNNITSATKPDVTSVAQYVLNTLYE